MRLRDRRATIMVRFCLRLCMILVPCFLVTSAIGLFFLTEHVANGAHKKLTERVESLSEGALDALGQLSGERLSPQNTPSVAVDGVMSMVLADPAIVCVSLHETDTGRAIVQLPSLPGCQFTPSDKVSERAFEGSAGVGLHVRWSLGEVRAVRDAQQRSSALIMIAGLMIALIVSWVTFRFFIGRSMLEMVRQIDDARQSAEVVALQDNMTGLANRRHLNQVISGRLDAVQEGRDPFAILQLDLDLFQDINDRFGHAAGDAMLRHIAHVLRTAVRPEDFVARVGGDEFVILAYGEVDRANLSTLAERIIRKISAPLIYQGHSCVVATSIGIYPVTQDTITDETTGDHILMNADFALRHCKALRRGQHLFFEEEMRSEVEAARFLASDFERGFKDAEIICFYQPQFDVSAQKVLSVEALARWKHPLLGLLNPADFLPLADKLELTAAVDEKILKLAMQDLQEWDRVGLGIESVSVNISAGRLEDPNLIESLRALDLPRGRVTFEILETAFVDELSDAVRWNLDGMRELGIEIELDDFGTGKASVLGIIEMAPHRIKVARELIANLSNGAQGISFVQAIAAIGHSLGVAMVAEGVEEGEHCRIAADLGFQRLQGYHISRPLPREAFEEWMRKDTFRLSA